MENIPGDMLAETLGITDPGAVLRTVAEHHIIRAGKLRAQRTRGWKGASDELDGVARHLTEYADALADHFALYGDAAPPAAVEPHPDAVPGLPGNTGRCASFRRATPDDQTLCSLPRGHEGDHASTTDGVGIEYTWPRTHSGAVCGDVVILPDSTALNCARPLGHDGDEHYDGRYRLWPRGVGTSRQVRVCEPCNTDTHACPGCGEPLGHFVTVCEACAHDEHGGRAETVVTDAKITNISLGPDGITANIDIQTSSGPVKVAFTDHDPQIVPPCHDRQRDDDGNHHEDATVCMLPSGHTGKHIGYTGARWERNPATEQTTVQMSRGPAVVTHPADSAVIVHDTTAGEFVEIVQTMNSGSMLGEVADAQRAAMAPSIPAQRESATDTPAAVMVAETKAEVTAAVNGFTGDEPIGTTVNVGGIEFVKHSNNPFGGGELSNPFQAITAAIASEVGTLSNPFMPPAPPAAPKAELLPPHLVPGSPKAYQSVSSIQTMSECGLRYRLQYRDGLSQRRTAWWNVGGTAFHKTVEHIERMHAESGGSLYPITEPVFQTERDAAAIWAERFAETVLSVEQTAGTGSTEWQAAKGGKENGAWWRVSGEDMVRRYVHHRRTFLEHWRLLTTPTGGFAQEVEFNAEIGGVPMKGFIDSAWISTDGSTIRVEDYKSGTSAGEAFQLKAYGSALRAMGADAGTDGVPRRIVGAFYEARKGASSSPLELTTADDAEVAYRANTTAAMDRAGIFPANPGRNGSNCSTCDVAASCPIMAMKS